jgi:hypothetical protein
MALIDNLRKVYGINQTQGDMTESPSANLPNLLFDPDTGEPIEPVGAVNLPNLIVDPNTGEPKEPIDTVNLPNFLIDSNMRQPKTPMTELPFGADTSEMMPELSPEKMEILEAIEEMQRQLMQTTDPEEAKVLSRIIQTSKPNPMKWFCQRSFLKTKSLKA